MDALIVALVLAVLCTPVIAVIALIQASSARRAIYHLETRLHELETKLRLLASGRAPTPPIAASEPASSASSLPLPVESAPRPQPAATATTSVPPMPAAPASAPPSPPPAPARSIGFEERFGTRWVVWVGGVALALGGIFLVRYTIQEGL